MALRNEIFILLLGMRGRRDRRSHVQRDGGLTSTCSDSEFSNTPGPKKVMILMNMFHIFYIITFYQKVFLVYDSKSCAA